MRYQFFTVISSFLQVQMVPATEIGHCRNNTRWFFEDKRAVAIKIDCLRFRSGYLL